MHPPLPSIVTAELRNAVGAVVERFASRAAIVDAGWEPFAMAAGLDAWSPSDDDDPLAKIIVGSVDSVLAAVRGRNDGDEFGFVTPAALRLKPWQRGDGFNDDPTLKLWQHGWSPIAVHRVIVAGISGETEFVVGNARLIPQVSTLDDVD